MSHFYHADGSPRHFIEMTSRPGELRPTRITDVRKAAKAGEPWFPSVSTVLNILDKPALKNWLVDQHLRQAWLISDMGWEGDFNAFRSEVRRLAELEMAKAPDAGTDIHDQLERWAGGDKDVERPDICDGVGTMIYDKTGVRLPEFSREQRFVHKAKGYAGTIDLFHESGIVIDYKSKRESAKFKPGKMGYPDHARQLAAYGEGKGCSPDDTIYANIFVCLETGELDWHHWSVSDIEGELENFFDCLKIYHRSIYNPLDYLEGA